MKIKTLNKNIIFTLFSVFFACFILLVIGNTTQSCVNTAKATYINEIFTHKTNFISQLQIENDINVLNSSPTNLGELLPEIIFKFNNESLKVESSHLENISNIRNNIISGGMKSRVKAMDFAFSNGFTKEQSVFYAFPELKSVINQIDEKMYIPAQDAMLKSYKNTGKIYITDAKKGSKMYKDKLFDDIFYKFNNFNNKYIIKVDAEDVNYNISSEAYENNNILRASFKTYFGTSSLSRKNNIKRALSCFDGKVLFPGEILSFNNTTGNRSESNGYEKAKIIKNGTFVEEFGGGVCQVSTTLYNSALLADLEIIEVHPHSLPVSYIEPCFDAMVNSGSSDLVIKNNLEYPIIFATCDKDDYCTVNIYGVKKNYEIVRKSEKTEELLHFTKERTSNYAAYGFLKPLGKGEAKTISYGKPGYRAIGKLEYYKNGILIKTKQIRSNTYNPTKEVVLIGEE